jgi:CHAD domain-containing protein
MSIPTQAASDLGLLIGKVAFQAGRCLRNPGAKEVHDLRVAIRRLQQGLAIFGRWLPEKPSNKIRKRTKRILKAAGEVRNLDIAMELADSAGLGLDEAMHGTVANDREAAAAQLSNALTRLLASKFSSKWRARLELDSTDRKSKDGVLAVAQELLPNLAEEFIQAGTRLAEHPESKRRLHTFRISAKRFRYSLEPFAKLYDSGLERRIKAVKKVQDVLGKLNDAVTTRAILKQRGAPPAVLNQLREEEAVRLTEYQELWPKLFESGAAEKWARYFQRAPVRRRKR